MHESCIVVCCASPFIIALLIIVHHFYIHKDDNHLNDIEKWIQYDDINNHETWWIFFVGIGVGMISGTMMME